MSERYMLILLEEGRYPVAMAARLLNVSRSGYYDWRKRPHEERWDQARDDVWRAWLESDGAGSFIGGSRT